MNIYHYHPQTGEFLGVGIADPDPRTEGGFLIPAYATTVQTPLANVGHAVVFADGAWSQVEDHRGVTVYSTDDRQPREIETLGPIPAGYTEQEPSSEWDVWDGSQWVEDTEARESAEQAQQDAAAREAAQAAAIEIQTRRLILDSELSDDDRARLIGAFPRWEPGVPVLVGDLRRYEAGLYECIQAHTTQADWTPPATPNLWNKVVAPGTIAVWVQPTGAHDAYASGAIVEHPGGSGNLWISTRNANVWEPGTPDSGWSPHSG